VRVDEEIEAVLAQRGQVVADLVHFRDGQVSAEGLRPNDGIRGSRPTNPHTDLRQDEALTGERLVLHALLVLELLVGRVLVYDEQVAILARHDEAQVELAHNLRPERIGSFGNSYCLNRLSKRLYNARMFVWLLVSPVESN